MKRFNCKISIYVQNCDPIVLDFTNEIEIISSWKNLTDTATITIPKKITMGGESIFAGSNALIKRGDGIRIELGYYPNLNVHFSGWVSKVENTSPVVIHCDDDMFLLKQNAIKKSFKSVDLDTLVSTIFSESGIIGAEYETPDADLGSFRITNATGCQVLKELKKTYLTDAFFIDEKLFVGLQYVPALSTEHELTFEKNIIDDGLEYQNADYIKIKMKAVSMLPDNTKIEVETGDPDGEVRTAYFYNITSTSELKKIANRELPKFKFTGYRGEFTTFGEPQLKHGDTIKLTSFKFPERDGEYFVDKVTTTFGQSGFRQAVEMGRKSEL